jgi:hypothetical protein
MKNDRNTKMKKGLALMILTAGVLGVVPPSFAHELA